MFYFCKRKKSSNYSRLMFLFFLNILHKLNVSIYILTTQLVSNNRNMFPATNQKEIFRLFQFIKIIFFPLKELYLTTTDQWLVNLWSCIKLYIIWRSPCHSIGLPSPCRTTFLVTLSSSYFHNIYLLAPRHYNDYYKYKKTTTTSPSFRIIIVTT